MGSPARRGTSAALTSWSLAALAAGIGLGALGNATDGIGFERFGAAIAPFGDLWVAALQMTVLPLVVSHMLAAVVGARGGESLGALGGRALFLFVAMLVAAGVFTLIAAPPLISLYPVDPAALDALRQATPVPQSAVDAAAAGTVHSGEWIANLLPSNLFEAARRGDVLALLLFSVLFGLAVRRLPEEQRAPLARAFAGLAAAMLTLVRWLLWGTPLGVFALSFGLAIETGLGAAGMLGAFVLVQAVLMTAFTLLLYPTSAVMGRVSIGKFARALAGAQLVAVSTRSSLAALPALVDGARTHLQLPASATSFTLPFSVSLFKVNRTISSTAKLLFLAYAFNVPLSGGTIAAFMLTVILLSFSAVGVPGGGGAFRTLPAYLAAGVPIEGIVIAEAVEAIPDIFKTALNVTGQMSAATILSRGSRVAQPAAAPGGDVAVAMSESAG
jgi:Na+/H+-dicarboxylate symporter